VPDPTRGSKDGDRTLRNRIHAATLLTAMGIAAAACVNSPPKPLYSDVNNRLVGASSVGNLNMVRALLAAGANVNFKDDHGYTALTLTLYAYNQYMNGWNGNEAFAQRTSSILQVVRALLAAGADAAATTPDGSTALWYALGFPMVPDRLEIVRVLCAAGADIDAALRAAPAQVRRAAAYALGHLNYPGAVEALIAALKDPDSSVRSDAAEALDLIHDRRAGDALLLALRERNTSAIAGAYPFFIRRGDTGSEDALIEALQKSGTTGMAEAFLNSGNSKLEQAAVQWASSHGYQIRPGGGQAIRWGGRR
jgi:hypothetical protein